MTWRFQISNSQGFMPGSFGAETAHHEGLNFFYIFNCVLSFLHGTLQFWDTIRLSQGRVGC
jgi:hypothetical protein